MKIRSIRLFSLDTFSPLINCVSRSIFWLDGWWWVAACLFYELHGNSLVIILALLLYECRLPYINITRGKSQLGALRWGPTPPPPVTPTPNIDTLYIYNNYSDFYSKMFVFGNFVQYLKSFEKFIKIKVQSRGSILG